MTRDRTIQVSVSTAARWAGRDRDLGEARAADRSGHRASDVQRAWKLTALDRFAR
ncbi:hypothetical protein [Amycolatopsis sp. NPDC051716]|uniref:hypothetical protein n=1 Tax=Amycolatopsis sp. NPDC051716 TaxID=3155804 RepID=UPI003445B4F9